MIATHRMTEKRKPLLPYLKPCSPSPGINADTSGNIRTDAFSRPTRLSKRRRRWLAVGWGAAQVTAVVMGLVLSKPALLPIVLPSAATPPPSAEQTLWAYLVSPAFEQDQAAATAHRLNQQLEIAQQERRQAQQLRIDAEEKAEALVAGAAKRARDTTMGAMRQADAVRLESTFIGAEQILYANTGDDVTLKFAARIQCKAGSFGETAVATPVEPTIAPREVRNLGTCYPNPHTVAGKPIGQVGAWGIAFFKLQ